MDNAGTTDVFNIMDAAVLTSWLGSGGKTVFKDVAELRADICRKCPLNVAPKWWEKMVKDPIAEGMRMTLELKHGLQLSVSDEDDLGVCKICGCCIPLKIWVPIEHVRNQVGNLHDAPPHCWMVSDQKK